MVDNLFNIFKNVLNSKFRKNDTQRITSSLKQCKCFKMYYFRPEFKKSWKSKTSSGLKLRQDLICCIISCSEYVRYFFIYINLRLSAFIFLCRYFILIVFTLCVKVGSLEENFGLGWCEWCKVSVSPLVPPYPWRTAVFPVLSIRDCTWAEVKVLSTTTWSLAKSTWTDFTPFSPSQKKKIFEKMTLDKNLQHLINVFKVNSHWHFMHSSKHTVTFIWL